MNWRWRWRRQLLQAPAEELTIANGRVLRKGMPAGPSLDLGEIAKKLGPGSELLQAARPVSARKAGSIPST